MYVWHPCTLCIFCILCRFCMYLMYLLCLVYVPYVCILCMYLMYLMYVCYVCALCIYVIYLMYVSYVTEEWQFRYKTLVVLFIMEFSQNKFLELQEIFLNLFFHSVFTWSYMQKKKIVLICSQGERNISTLIRMKWIKC